MRRTCPTLGAHFESTHTHTHTRAFAGHYRLTAGSLCRFIESRLNGFTSRPSFTCVCLFLSSLLGPWSLSLCRGSSLFPPPPLRRCASPPPSPGFTITTLLFHPLPSPPLRPLWRDEPVTVTGRTTSSVVSETSIQRASERRSDPLRCTDAEHSPGSVAK